MKIKEGFWKNPEWVKGFAACDNPNCPRHRKETERYPYDSYQNGEITLCETCVEVDE